MSEKKQTECLFSIEIFSDDIIVIQYGKEKMVRKITNPLAIMPMLLSLITIPLGSKEVKNIETWLDHVWIKRLKRA